MPVSNESSRQRPSAFGFGSGFLPMFNPLGALWDAADRMRRRAPKSKPANQAAREAWKEVGTNLENTVKKAQDKESHVARGVGKATPSHAREK